MLGLRHWTDSVITWREVGELICLLWSGRVRDFMGPYPKCWVFLAQSGPREKESRALWKQVDSRPGGKPHVGSLSFVDLG